MLFYIAVSIKKLPVFIQFFKGSDRSPIALAAVLWNRAISSGLLHVSAEGCPPVWSKNSQLLQSQVRP